MGRNNMFLLEDLLNSVQVIWTGSGEEKAKKGQGGRESDWNCRFKCLKTATSSDLEKDGHEQYQCIF